MSKEDPLRQSVDLREWDSPVKDQGHLGSCEGNAIASAYELQVRRLHPEKYSELSSMFVYYNSRVLERQVDEDRGANLYDGMEALQKWGICSERVWPYNIHRFTIKPSELAYLNGLGRTITDYRFLNNIDDIMQVINSNKPVVVGIKVYSNFNDLDLSNATLTIPNDNTERGKNHAMIVLGYDIPKQIFILKNSFSTDWGDNGYCYAPFDYARTEIFERMDFDITDQSKAVN